MNTLKVDINIETNEISVWNNGKGIPVVLHKEHGVYVPELIFGHLLTGSNFNDSKKKTTGGRNGYGAKLANIFSKEFVVETASGEQKKYYKQVFSNNMADKDTPVLKSYTKPDFTCITFTPDLARFQMEGLEEDIVALMKKRVYDIAGTTKGPLKVYLNGVKITTTSFEKYASMYSSASLTDTPVLFDEKTDRWHVGVGLSDDGLQQGKDLLLHYHNII